MAHARVGASEWRDNFHLLGFFFNYSKHLTKYFSLMIVPKANTSEEKFLSRPHSDTDDDDDDVCDVCDVGDDGHGDIEVVDKVTFSVSTLDQEIQSDLLTSRLPFARKRFMFRQKKSATMVDKLLT